MEPGNNPDRQQEMARLRVVVSFLDDWGVMYLRAQIRKRSLELSTLENLPVEILHCIVPYLRLGNWFNCRLVSTGWRHAWSHPMVVLSLCRRYFPGLRQMNPSLDPDELFRKTVTKHLQWDRRRRTDQAIPQNITWWSMATSFDEQKPTSSPSNDRHSPLGVNFPVQYSDGKLAWQPSHERVVIEDLHQQTCQDIGLTDGFLSGKRLQVEGLSSKLLVMAGSRLKSTAINTLWVLSRICPCPVIILI